MTRYPDHGTYSEDEGFAEVSDTSSLGGEDVAVSNLEVSEGIGIVMERDRLDVVLAWTELKPSERLLLD